MDFRLEVVTLPVSDIDRAKAFYTQLGWRLDADIAFGDTFRVVQFTPPGSDCSIQFGRGRSSATPGAGLQNGPDPKHQSYMSFVKFDDPDGNGWLVQEVGHRLPGRGGPDLTA
jgi:catechol 2,3-dioxygenase-like lactoylglutathione lyase family enzyme